MRVVFITTVAIALVAAQYSRSQLSSSFQMLNSPMSTTTTSMSNKQLIESLCPVGPCQFPTVESAPTLSSFMRCLNGVVTDNLPKDCKKKLRNIVEPFVAPSPAAQSFQATPATQSFQAAKPELTPAQQAANKARREAKLAAEKPVITGNHRNDINTNCPAVRGKCYFPYFRRQQNEEGIRNFMSCVDEKVETLSKKCKNALKDISKVILQPQLEALEAKMEQMRPQFEAEMAAAKAQKEALERQKEAEEAAAGTTTVTRPVIRPATTRPFPSTTRPSTTRPSIPSGSISSGYRVPMRTTGTPITSPTFSRPTFSSSGTSSSFTPQQFQTMPLYRPNP